MPDTKKKPAKRGMSEDAAGSSEYRKWWRERNKESDREHRAIEGVQDLIAYITRGTALKQTPTRVVAAWANDWGKGYREEFPDLRCFADIEPFPDTMVVQRDILFHSSCEHHLAPFFGTVDIAYIPQKSKGVLGLSKFARLVEHFSRRLQVQERLTEQIAQALAEHVSPDVAVTIRARHMCMCSRGVRQPHSETTTTALRGAFKNEPETRAEYYACIQSKA